LLSSAFLAMLSTVTDLKPFSKNNFLAALRMALFLFSFSRILLFSNAKIVEPFLLKLKNAFDGSQGY
jgi:hypothetical protein